MIHFTIDLTVLLIAIPVGFITFKKSNPLYLKLLPFFLLLTMAVELIGELLQGPGRNNLLLFNLFTVIEFCYYTWFFSEVTHGKRVKRSIQIIKYLLPTICLINIFFLQGPTVFHTYTYCAACLIMVGLGITYFYQLFYSSGRIDLRREPAFWISIGIVFFFTCAVSVIGVINYVSTLPRNIAILLQKIFLLINAFFYIFFIIAFLCNRINTRK